MQLFLTVVIENIDLATGESAVSNSAGFDNFKLLAFIFIVHNSLAVRSVCIYTCTAITNNWSYFDTCTYVNSP